MVTETAVVDIKEAARVTGFSVFVLRKAVRSGKLLTVSRNLGIAKYFFTRKQLEDFVTSIEKGGDS